MTTGQEIGEGGMSFECLEEIAEGGQVVVNFRIPGGDFVSLRATVRSVRPGERGTIVGLSFEKIAFSLKRQIRSYVSTRSESEQVLV